MSAVLKYGRVRLRGHYQQVAVFFKNYHDSTDAVLGDALLGVLPAQLVQGVPRRTLTR